MLESSHDTTEKLNLRHTEGRAMLRTASQKVACTTCQLHLDSNMLVARQRQLLQKEVYSDSLLVAAYGYASTKAWRR